MTTELSPDIWYFILKAILTPPEDELGTPSSSAMGRVTHLFRTTSDVQSMIDQLKKLFAGVKVDDIKAITDGRGYKYTNKTDLCTHIATALWTIHEEATQIINGTDGMGAEDNGTDTEHVIINNRITEAIEKHMKEGGRNDDEDDEDEDNNESSGVSHGKANAKTLDDSSLQPTANVTPTPETNDQQSNTTPRKRPAASPTSTEKKRKKRSNTKSNVAPVNILTVSSMPSNTTGK